MYLRLRRDDPARRENDVVLILGEDIRGIRRDGDILRSECITDEEWDETTQDQIITDDELADSYGIYFCDRCNGRI